MYNVIDLIKHAPIFKEIESGFKINDKEKENMHFRSYCGKVPLPSICTFKRLNNIYFAQKR